MLRKSLAVLALNLAFIIPAGVLAQDAPATPAAVQPTQPAAAQPAPQPSASVKVDFTAQEVQALGRLLDQAVKCGGLPVAQNAVVLAQKLQTALDAASKADASPAKQK